MTDPASTVAATPDSSSQEHPPRSGRTPAQAPLQATQEQVLTPFRQLKARVPEPLKAGYRRSARAIGWASAPARTDPDFLIIGTKRGGTTSLWYALAGHPDVLPLFPAAQELKSAHYFDINYRRGRQWYRSFFATRAARVRHLRRTGNPPLAGEASPYYMFHPLAAERIRADLPGVKLLVSLRDPVERLWSHYFERVAGHTETLPIADALAAEPERLAGQTQRIVEQAPHYYSHHHDLSSYLARGRYLEHLQAFLDRFGPDQLLILRAEDYYTDPEAELDKVARHLGLRPFPANAQTAHYNRLPRAPMPPELRAELVDYYRPHVASLEAALGRSFNWRNFRQ